jgi:hypothetical protein
VRTGETACSTPEVVVEVKEEGTNLSSPRGIHKCNSLFVWLVADGWCWFVLREKYC